MFSSNFDLVNRSLSIEMNEGISDILPQETESEKRVFALTKLSKAERNYSNAR